MKKNTLGPRITIKLVTNETPDLLEIPDAPEAPYVYKLPIIPDKPAILHSIVTATFHYITSSNYQ